MPMTRKLGKRAPRIDHRTLRLAKYLIKGIVDPPEAASFNLKVTDWGMMKNDTLGDCTCACLGHMIKQWTKYAQAQEAVITDNDVLKMYEDPSVGNYNPADPSTDQGAVVLDVLNYARTHGLAGHKIKAYATLAPFDPRELKLSVSLFGNAYLGLAMPISAQSQDVWHVLPTGPTGDGSPGSWGGHAVPVVAYDMNGLYVITWGERKQMTWHFYSTYCDEAYAVLSKDWIEGPGFAPNSIDLVTLEKDLVAVTH